MRAWCTVKQCILARILWIGLVIWEIRRLSAILRDDTLIFFTVNKCLYPFVYIDFTHSIIGERDSYLQGITNIILKRDNLYKHHRVLHYVRDKDLGHPSKE